MVARAADAPELRPTLAEMHDLPAYLAGPATAAAAAAGGVVIVPPAGWVRPGLRLSGGVRFPVRRQRLPALPRADGRGDSRLREQVRFKVAREWAGLDGFREEGEVRERWLRAKVFGRGGGEGAAGECSRPGMPGREAEKEEAGGEAAATVAERSAEGGGEGDSETTGGGGELSGGELHAAGSDGGAAGGGFPEGSGAEVAKESHASCCPERSDRGGSSGAGCARGSGSFEVPQSGLEGRGDAGIPAKGGDGEGGSGTAGPAKGGESPSIAEYEDAFWKMMARGLPGDGGVAAAEDDGRGERIELCYGVDVEAEGSAEPSRDAVASVGRGRCHQSQAADVGDAGLEAYAGLACTEGPGKSAHCSLGVDGVDVAACGGSGGGGPGPRWHAGNINCAGVLRHLPRMPGINHSMFYVGQMFTRFCWHIEDGYLNSISYMHDGSADKVWYVVPPKYADEFEAYAAQEVYSPALLANAKSARALLEDKTTLFDPYDIARRGIPVYRIVQKPGTFAYLAPRAYHAGFNTGFNIAEAVNFAQPSWFPFGRLASASMRAVLKAMPIPREYLLFREAVEIADAAMRAGGVSAGGVVDVDSLLARNARVVANELRSLIEEGEEAISSLVASRDCRLAENVSFEVTPAAPTVACTSAAGEGASPIGADGAVDIGSQFKGMLIPSNALVAVRHAAQIDPSFGDGAGLACAECRHASHFYSVICGSCPDGGRALCMPHFSETNPECDMAGHTVMIVRRHSPLLLNDILRACESAAGIMVDDATILRRYTDFVRCWDAAVGSNGGKAPTLMERLPKCGQLLANTALESPLPAAPAVPIKRGRGRPRKDGTVGPRPPVVKVPVEEVTDAAVTPLVADKKVKGRAPRSPNSAAREAVEMAQRALKMAHEAALATRGLSSAQPGRGRPNAGDGRLRDSYDEDSFEADKDDESVRDDLLPSSRDRGKKRARASIGEHDGDASKLKRHRKGKHRSKSRGREGKKSSRGPPNVGLSN